jgi:type VI secretion system secreted protein VgrG
VNLKTTAGFAVLAGRTITNTGPTTITGDVGLSPGSAFVDTGVTLNGAKHISDAVAVQAMSDLVDVYNDAAGRPVSSSVPVDLGGLTLGPGVYSSGGVLGITGTLTLNAKGDPNAVFIFQSTSTLITASGSNIRLINGARFCRVFWVVPSSATLGTDSTFVGHIFAVTSIAAKTGATVQGQLLARTGEVTLDTNTITNAICANVSPSPTPSATTTPSTGPTVPGLPTTGYPPEQHGLPWLLVAGSFAACMMLLFAAWRFHAASRRHG